MKVGFDGIYVHARCTRNLRDIHVFEELQQQDPALVDRKHLQGRLHLFGPLTSKHPRFRRPLIGWKEGRKLRNVQRGRLGLAPELEALETDLVPDKVIRNTHEPCAHTTFTAKRLPPVIRLQKTVLRDRLRKVFIPNREGHKAKHSRPIDCHERIDVIQFGDGRHLMSQLNHRCIERDLHTASDDADSPRFRLHRAKKT